MIGAKSKLEGENAASLYFIWMSGFAMLAAIPMMYIAGAMGSAIAGIISALIGLQIGKKYFISKTPTWRELRDAKQKEKKRILDNESGTTAKKSLQRLEKMRICRIEGSIDSKMFDDTWWIWVRDGDQVITCALANNKDSKLIEKLKQKTDDGQADHVKLIGYLCAPHEFFENIKNDSGDYSIVGCELI